MIETKPSRLLAAGLRRLAGMLDPPPPVRTDVSTVPEFSADARPVAPEHWLARLEQAGLSTAAYRTGPQSPSQQGMRATPTRAGPFFDRILRMLRPGRAAVPGNATDRPATWQSPSFSETGSRIAEPANRQTGVGSSGSARNPAAKAAVPRVLRRQPRIAAVLPTIDADPSVPVAPNHGPEPAGQAQAGQAQGVQEQGSQGQAGQAQGSQGQGALALQGHAVPSGTAVPSDTLAPTPTAAGNAAPQDLASAPSPGRLLLHVGRRPQDTSVAPSSASASARQPFAVFRPASGSKENPRTDSWDDAHASGAARRSAHREAPSAASPPDPLSAAQLSAARPSRGPTLAPPPSQVSAQNSPVSSPAPPFRQNAARQPAGVSAIPPAAAMRPVVELPELASAVAEVPPWPELPVKNRAMTPAIGTQEPAQWLDALARTSRLVAEQGAH